MAPEWIEVGFAGLVGLLVGSFLNVVILRFPKMLERQWARECAEFQNQPPPSQETAFNLMTPASHCPSCGHAIRWYENIPVFSFLVLRGQCSACKTRISARYPLTELAAAVLFALEPGALDHCLAALIFLFPRLQAEEKRREIVRGDAFKHRTAGKRRQVIEHILPPCCSCNIQTGGIIL